MARERTVRPKLTSVPPSDGEPPDRPAPELPGGDDFGEDSIVRSLRPKRLREFIGHPELVEHLEVAIQAAAKRGEPLDHVLFSGPPGLGKTTLANIIAAELGAKIVATSGPALDRPADVMGILTNLDAGDVLFIDEIHRLSRTVEEFLYSAMEDFRVDFVLEKGVHARTMKFPLKPFTLVGATTRRGLLTAPLRERFGILHQLDFYGEAELAEIVERSAKILGVPIEPDAAGEISRRSRGTPRIANRLLRRARDYAEVRANGTITDAIAQEALLREGIDELGLDNLDRRFLRTILENYRGGPVGIEALAATLYEEVDTLVDAVEPYLLKTGLLIRTPAGRKAADLARAHLGHPEGNQGRLL
ncbi:MAG TPA: Holliday junction branch migration DNA helicase RuvB [Dehalococcoidia bacterium]|nr:Holliday junction branch migration DNA helicase RuvB [Dehalococcoidia bacterium]